MRQPLDTTLGKVFELEIDSLASITDAGCILQGTAWDVDEEGFKGNNNGYFDIPRNLFNTNQEMSFRFHYTSFPQNTVSNKMLWTLGSTGGVDEIRFLISTANDLILIGYDQKAAVAFTPSVNNAVVIPALMDGNPHVMTVTFKGGSNIRLYVDDLLVINSTISVPIPNCNNGGFLRIGAALTGGNRYVGNPLKKIELFNRLLTEYDVERLNNGTWGDAKLQNLDVYMEFDKFVTINGHEHVPNLGKLGGAMANGDLNTINRDLPKLYNGGFNLTGSFNFIEANTPTFPQIPAQTEFEFTMGFYGNFVSTSTLFQVFGELAPYGGEGCAIFLQNFQILFYLRNALRAIIPMNIRGQATYIFTIEEKFFKVYINGVLAASSDFSNPFIFFPLASPTTLNFFNQKSIKNYRMVGQVYSALFDQRGFGARQVQSLHEQMIKYPQSKTA